MTVLEMKQKLGRLSNEAEQLTQKRNLNPAEQARAQQIVNEMSSLMADIDESERREGFTGVERPQRGGPMFRNGYGTATADSTEPFWRWVQSGDEGARSEAQSEIRAEYRANATSLNITTAADGGDLVPVGLAERIFAKASEVSIYDKLGLTQVRGVGTTVDQPVETGTLNLFVATAESAENDLDAPAYGKKSFTLRKLTKRQDVTSELLQDSPTNLVEHISDYVGRAYASTIDYEVLTAALAGATAALTFDSASTVAASEVPEMAFKLAGGWEHGNSIAWVMSRATEGVIRSIASSSVFTFAPNPAGGMTPQSMLWGYPIYTSSHMPAIGAGNKSIILGNWRAMGIRLDPTLTMLRDVYSRAAFDEVRFHWKFRMDTEVLNAAGLALGTHPTA